MTNGLLTADRDRIIRVVTVLVSRLDRRVYVLVAIERRSVVGHEHAPR